MLIAFPSLRLSSLPSLQRDDVRCVVTATFGPGRWPLPPSEISFPESPERYKLFAKALLEGQVSRKRRGGTTMHGPVHVEYVAFANTACRFRCLQSWASLPTSSRTSHTLSASPGARCDPAAAAVDEILCSLALLPSCSLASWLSCPPSLFSISLSGHFLSLPNLSTSCVGTTLHVVRNLPVSL